MVACGPLRGYGQTAARAEVRALVAAVEIAEREVIVVSDNKYVVRIASAIMGGQNPRWQA